MQRLLLILPTAPYRAPDFMAAARELGVAAPWPPIARRRCRRSRLPCGEAHVQLRVRIEPHAGPAREAAGVR